MHSTIYTNAHAHTLQINAGGYKFSPTQFPLDPKHIVAGEKKRLHIFTTI